MAITSQLTEQQRLAIKSYIANNPSLSQQANIGNYDGLANAMNQLASPAWSVWRSTVSVDSLTDAIIWANMTPSQSPDGTQAWANRALQCQGKQMNLQNLIIGKQVVEVSRANIRAAFQDCLTQLPSAPNGSNQSAGWVAVQALMQRTATVAEKILSTGTGSQASPADLGWEGQIDVLQIGWIIS